MEPAPIPRPVPVPIPAPVPAPIPAPARNEGFVEIGRIPDFLKDLRSFSGNPTELMNWILDVEGIFQMYQHIPRDSLNFDLIEKSVRRRIVGEAADVLNANNVTSDWAEIKSTLLLYYSDKRELKTLDFELTTIKKSSSESLSGYYSRVNELLSAIIAQVQTDEKYRGNAAIYIDYFREKALDSFIRGHERNLSLLLKTARPKTLSSALQFCLDYHNMDIRSGPIRSESANVPPKPRELEVPRSAPKLPPKPLGRPPMHGFPPQPPPKGYPYPPRPYPYPPNPPRPFPPRPYPPSPNRPNQSHANQPRPEPMEVDPSIRSKNVNYGNRPQQNLKRPHPPSQQFQDYKRVAHPVEYEYFDYYAYYYPEYYGYYEGEVTYQDQNSSDTI